ncbi:TPA: hypothetical protein ACGF6D_003533, partial [Vibrio cholerae]
FIKRKIKLFQGIQLTAPLPIATIITVLGGAIYTIFKFRRVIKSINEHKGKAISQAFKNFHLCETELHQAIYPPLDPDKEMESLCKSWIVRVYSGKHANLLYSRVEDCLCTHKFLLNSAIVDESLNKRKYFNKSYLNNLILYFFLVDLLQKNNDDRIKELELFDSDKNYIYCPTNGYFKEYTTISYQP